MMFKPMLATEIEWAKLKFPVLASVKLDGVRAIVINGVVLSRSLKPIPNAYVQRLFKQYEFLDGELIVGDPRSPSCLRDTMSCVMAHDKEDFDVTFYAFDHIQHPLKPFVDRVPRISHGKMTVLDQHYINDLPTLEKYERQMLDLGNEGVVLRDPRAQYKYGRSTANEGGMLKLKRFTDGEFEVVGFEERLHNANVLEVDELGYAKRSSHQANLVGRGDLGALVCSYDGTTFNVGTGFDDSQRAEIWAHREQYLGNLAKVKYFAVGMKDLPRHPVFLGWRPHGT